MSNKTKPKTKIVYTCRDGLEMIANRHGAYVWGKDSWEYSSEDSFELEIPINHKMNRTIKYENIISIMGHPTNNKKGE